MSDYSLTALLESTVAGLLATVEATAERSSATGLQVSDVRVEIPAFLRLSGDADVSERLRVALPELRRSPPRGLVGRIEIEIARETEAHDGAA